VGDFQLTYTKPRCKFPADFAGVWFHTSEYNIDVNMNATHIYFKTKYDLYTYKETYFVCLMNSDTRYLTLAVTIGKWWVGCICYKEQ